MNIKLSQNFKKMTTKAILAIVVFILVYLLLLALGLLLAIASVCGGIALIVAAPKFITILLGVGLASLGIIVFIFLIKFLFKRHTVDRSHLTEIYKDEYPRLFAFIEDIAKETGTKFPKKIYLSVDVNAAVFYDSSFWSMFFPIRKNLQIGLGLVNTVTELELKAILAHEFGHFSQRSMSVGSYVYNVNQVIFNMLYDNDSFDSNIQAWANITGYFSIFVIVAVKIIQGIQWILQQMYRFVNLSYMALSREMEFYADEVAANVAGSKPLIESLLRIDFSQRAFNWALSFYENRPNKTISENIYKDQSYVLGILAQEYKMPLKNNLPQVSISDINKYNQTKINIEDQWASHPSTEERVSALQKLNIIKGEDSYDSAMGLLPHAKNVEEVFTKTIFYNITFQNDTEIWGSEKFQKEFSEDIVINSFPSDYNEYYDNKNPIPFDLDKIIDFSLAETMETLFGKVNVGLVYNDITLSNDINTLKAINNGEIKIKTFEYDGQRYTSAEVYSLICRVEKEAEDIRNKIAENDISIYKFFYNQAQKKGLENELKQKYSMFFDQDIICNRRIGIFNKFAEFVDQLNRISQQSQVEEVFSRISGTEVELKKEIEILIKSPSLAEDITDTMKSNFEKYLSRNWSYSANEASDNEYLDTLFTAVSNFRTLGARAYFLSKLDLLTFQVGLLDR